MRRWTFNILAIISAILCSMTAALWVRTYVATDSIRWADAHLWQGWVAGHGSILYIRAYHGGNEAPEALNHQREPPIADIAAGQWLVKNFLRLGGFGFGTGAGLGYDGFAVIIPLWFVLCSSLALPALWVSRWRSSRKPRGGHCGTCGYNLTGNTSGVCPECGTVIKPPDDVRG